MKKVRLLLIILSICFCKVIFPQSAFEQRLIEKFKPPKALVVGLDQFFMQNNLTGDITKLQKSLDDFFVARENAKQLLVGSEKQMAGSTRMKIIGRGDVVTVVSLIGDQTIADFVLKVPRRIPQDKGQAPWFLYCATRENVSRVLKAAQLRTFIEQNQIKKIKVPQKYLYHIPGAAKELNDTNYLVVAEKFDLLPSATGLVFTQVTTPQIFDLFKIITAVGHRDFNDGNIALSKDAEVVFIDTDEMEVFLFEEGAEFDHEGIKALAFLAAQKLLQMFEDMPQLKWVFGNNNVLGINKALACPSDLKFDDSFRLIKFLKNLCLLGAIKNDVNYFPAADKSKILRYAYTQWLQRVCFTFNLSEQERAWLCDGGACYCQGSYDESF